MSISVDGDRLIWVLTTLLANAIKFSDQESTISLSAKAGMDWVKFEVADQASEIPDELRESIFGKMGVESNDGQGNRFWCLIPVSPV